MPTGLKEEWGLKDAKAAPSTKQADEFKAAYQAKSRPINEDLQYTVINGEKPKHAEKATQRDDLASTYQAVLVKIDPRDPSKAKAAIDAALAKAASVANAVAQFKREVEKALNDWLAKEPLYDKAVGMIEELEQWGDKSAATLRAVIDAIRKQVNDKLFNMAVKAVEALMAKLQPIYDEYLKQKAAKETYDSELAALQPQLAKTAECRFAKLEPMQNDIASVQQQMEAAAVEKNYVQALQLLGDLRTKVEAYLAAVEELEKKKAEYTEARTALDPKLTQASQSQYAKLEPMQKDMQGVQSQMDSAAQSEDYDAAVSHVKDLGTKVDAYNTAKTELEAKKKAYEDALAALQPKLGEASQCQYKKLEPIQQEMTRLQTEMETAAKAEDYEQALTHANSLSAKVDEYCKAKEELEKTKAEYEQALAALQANLTNASTCEYKSLAELDQQIADLTTRMEKAAADEDYEQALQLVKELSAKVDEKLAKVAERDAKKQEYEQAHAALQPRLTQASTCRHESLAELDKQIADLTGKMEAAAADQNYEEALKILATLSKKVDEKLAEEGRIDRKIIGSAQKERADKRLASLDEESRKRYNKLAEQAKSPQEMDYLSKALAANHKIEDIEKFAEKIRGKDEKWLNDNLKLTGSSTGTGVKQQWSHSCNATTVQAIKGEMDPLYALKLHEENKDISAADDTDATKVNPKLAEEQRKQLESEYSGKADGKHKGVAANRENKDKKGSGRWADDLMNDMSDVTGIEYANKKVDGSGYKVEDAMKDVEAGAKKGHPVPITVGKNQGAYSHYVLVTGVEEGPPKQWVIHDPGSGKTFKRSAEDVKNGNMNIGAYKQITALDNPSTKK